ncbi:MAG: uridine kinase [Reichenbachiella sp.]
MNTYTPFVVGITGGSASGKTLFLKELQAQFDKDQICVLSQDNYYLGKDQQYIDKQGVHDFDRPASIDHHQFAQDVLALKNRKTVNRQEYTFNNPDITPKDLVFEPAPIIVVEGIFVFHLLELATLIDLKVFIDSSEHLMLKRRIKRDAIERGYDLDDVLYRFENHVMPTYNEYIKPLKTQADIIIPNFQGNMDKGLDILSSYLKAKL